MNSKQRRKIKRDAQEELENRYKALCSSYNIWLASLDPPLNDRYSYDNIRSWIAQLSDKDLSLGYEYHRQNSELSLRSMERDYFIVEHKKRLDIIVEKGLCD